MYLVQTHSYLPQFSSRRRNFLLDRDVNCSFLVQLQTGKNIFSLSSPQNPQFGSERALSHSWVLMLAASENECLSIHNFLNYPLQSCGPDTIQLKLLQALQLIHMLHKVVRYCATLQTKRPKMFHHAKYIVIRFAVLAPTLLIPSAASLLLPTISIPAAHRTKLRSSSQYLPTCPGVPQEYCATCRKYCADAETTS